MSDVRLVDMQPAPAPQLKVARIEIELDDGTILLWKGEDAIKYVKTVDDVLLYHQARTGSALDFPAPTRKFRAPGAGGKEG